MVENYFHLMDSIDTNGIERTLILFCIPDHIKMITIHFVSHQFLSIYRQEAQHEETENG